MRAKRQIFPQSAGLKGSWVYGIRNLGQGVNVNKALDGTRGYMSGVFTNEREIAFMGGIDPSKIVQAEWWAWGMPAGRVIKNPWYSG
ncbi:hypothetical protein [Streptomyces sp. NPDC004134]|uniref:scabin-related ADP-ribosyltransferase n=1 Tax=Streptomyces sp. NPDC004134 TaxID=3364691 RepID=UPI00369079ED